MTGNSVGLGPNFSVLRRVGSGWVMKNGPVDNSETSYLTVGLTINEVVGYLLNCLNFTSPQPNRVDYFQFSHVSIS